jgi:hypothetical protein
MYALPPLKRRLDHLPTKGSDNNKWQIVKPQEE